MLCVVKINFLILLTVTLCYASLEKECPPRWFDCGNGKCILDIWRCDDDNDCGNLEDERNCDERLNITCLSSQFSCESDQHCIPERWHCDGESDCEDGSDEQHCDNSTTDCVGGFLCQDHLCIPMKWYCDGHKDCSDGSDEVCTTATLCADDEFLCSSGSCLNRSLVCDGRNDCSDGSDEGIYCGDSCANASCSQKCDSTPAGPLCYCDAGYNLDTKDNETCVDIDECLEEGFCSHACSNVPGSYTCSCLDGYELVNRTCRAKGADPLLIFSTLEEIRGMRLRSGRYFLVRKAVRRSAAVDADPGSERVYWVEISNTSSVYSAKVDGTGFRTVLSHGLLVPEDIAVDYVARNLYLTDSGLKQVLVCKMDGTVCSVLHDKNIDKPRSLALHFAEGFLYWSDWGDKTAGIYRSGMDGSARIHLVSRSTEWPNGIAIDHTVNRLYWADAKLNTIECIFLDGSTRRVISSGTVFHPYSLAVFEDTLYWTDWSTFSLESCNKFTGHKTTLMTRENGEHIMGVHVYHPVLAERVINPCWSNDCSHMCLIAPSHGFRCACPPGFNLSVDNRTCTMKDFSPSVFVSEGSSVFYMRPESVGSEAIRELPLSLGEIVISKVSYDPKSRTLFVADLKAPAIHEVNMTSLQIRELVKNNVVSPDDMAFDWMSNNLYWVDSSKGTVEVISADGLKRVVLIEDIPGPIALAISQTGHMFVASVARPSISMYDMDGKDKRILYSEESFPMSLAVHPTRTLLYWADPRAGTISFVDYITQRSPRVVMNRIPGIMSVAVNEDYLYWTLGKRELHLRKDNSTFFIRLPGQDKGTVGRKVTYIPVRTASGTSVCLLANGGCSFLCLSSPTGRTCACPAGVKLANDNVTCEEDLCSPNDFRCKNGRCILKSFRCDRRDDCADNSDEEDCPEAGVCEKGQVSCGDGQCIATLWRCDGEPDCTDSSDEIDCNETRCDSESQVRCDTGQCIPILWACDGSNDCLDGSDEKNCGKKKQNCSFHEYRCEEDGRCIDEVLKCDGRFDCSDGSDEKGCQNSTADCKSGMYKCKDGKCIYDYEVCDGHRHCDGGEEELNCTHTKCQVDEILCQSSKRCILKRWLCDGDEDCSDGSDEENCMEHKSRTPPPDVISREDLCSPNDFKCKNGRCILKSFHCDRRDDCADNSDEEDCPEAAVCAKDQMSCGDGQCIPFLWRCDGELDCIDSTDEIGCNATECDSESQVRCDNGQCIPITWACDGSSDCKDGSDEKNCGKKKRNCSFLEYRCEEDGRCIDEVLKCDGRPDCSDGSDEKGCRSQECEEFFCYLTAECLPWSRVCDGRQDCEDLPDEGGMCRSSCSRGNGGCAQMCRKSPQGPNCACYNGYRLRPDKKTCDDIDECLEPGTCSHFCNNTKGGFKCSCAEGYFLHHDHKTCKADGGPASLVYLLGDQIRGIDLALHTQRVYIKVKDADMRGMDYDASERIFYWTNWRDGSINSYSLDTHKQDVITRSSRYIYVRYDWIAGNLYYTDDDANIGVCSKDGKCCKSLMQFEYGTDVASLDISPTAGLMFWTRSMRNRSSGVIERAEMDGSKRLVIVSDKTIWPTAVTVEHVLKMIYWTDVKLNILECADFQGLHRRRIATCEMLFPFSLAVFEDHVYWADWGTSSIIRCHKFNSTDCSKIHDSNVRPEILKVVHKAMQPKGEKQHNCSLLEYRCEEDGRCIDEVLKCDGRADCSDGSDERDCRKIYGDNAQAEKLVHSQDLAEWQQKMDILSTHSRKSRGNLLRKKLLSARQKKKHMRKRNLRQNKTSNTRI